MASTDIGDLAARKTEQLLRRSILEVWAASATIWTRLLVLAAPGWEKWPRAFDTVAEALSKALKLGALSQAEAESIGHESFDLLLSKLEALEMEDDGSAEWQLVIDLVGMLTVALNSKDAQVCLSMTIRTYLEGTFNILANQIAVAEGRSISLKEARERLASDSEWQYAVEFMMHL